MISAQVARSPRTFHDSNAVWPASHRVRQHGFD